MRLTIVKRCFVCHLYMCFESVVILCNFVLLFFKWRGSNDDAVLIAAMFFVSFLYSHFEECENYILHLKVVVFVLECHV